MKYPIGIQSFDRLREDGFVYVDKTALVYNLVQTGSIYFLSFWEEFVGEYTCLLFSGAERTFRRTGNC